MLYYIKKYWILNISFYISYMLATYRNIFVTLLRCCSGVLGRAGVDSSVLVLARALSGICSGVRGFTRAGTRAQSSVLGRSMAYRGVLERVLVLERTRAYPYSSAHERTRAYSGVLWHTQSYSSVCASTQSAAANRGRNGIQAHALRPNTLKL